MLELLNFTLRNQDCKLYKYIAKFANYLYKIIKFPNLVFQCIFQTLQVNNFQIVTKQNTINVSIFFSFINRLVKIHW